MEERTRRRAQELEAKGYQVDMDSLRNEIKNRDQMDSERKVGALKVTPDSVLIDTSELSSEEVLSKVIQVIRGGA
ncbi:MAG: (d)CMP kinase [Chitinophagales bacterium]